MGKHTVEMSDQEKAQAIETARELAAEFEKVGQPGDEENRLPLELVDPYKESGLVGIAVPKEYGGGGADILTLSLISRELAKGDPACALAFNMHQTMVGIFRGLIPKEAKEEWFPKIVEEKQIVCGPFSEERAGLTGLADTTAAPHPDGGWIINGKKTWATLCEAADIISFNATVVDDDGVGQHDLMQKIAAENVFIADMNAPGISIKRTWDTMGMRATGTQTVVFEDVHLPHDAIAGNFRGGLFGEFEWAAMTFSGVYLGLLDKVYEYTKETLRKKTLGATMEGDDVQLKGIGYVQQHLGQMYVDREVGARILENTCQQLIEGRDEGMAVMQRVGWLDVVKVTITESAIDAADRGMRAVGGMTFRRGNLLERMYRDARSGPFHPLTTDQTYDALGRFELGLMDQQEQSAEAEDSAAEDKQKEKVAA
jgi:alkylation response protein AidB-like acyl-CoA dehydrogenase